jgi:predicted nucleic acid-binding protein
MKNKAVDLMGYAFSAGEAILVDTNVWMYLAPPPSSVNNRAARIYSKAFANLLQQKAVAFVDALILSEYLNRYIRIEYQANWRYQYPDFKRFRQSVNASAVLGDAVVELKQIMKHASVCNTLLVDIDLADVLDHVQNGSMDLNDGLLVANCKRNGWKLMTHDGDMSSGGIEVLTANSNLLQACAA